VASNRTFLIRALKRQLPRSEVFEAEDGQQAVRIIEEDLRKFHVVCMDKEMPVSSVYLPPPPCTVQ
jgi:CheY-like chemotaxis protein